MTTGWTTSRLRVCEHMQTWRDAWSLSSSTSTARCSLLTTTQSSSVSVWAVVLSPSVCLCNNIVFTYHSQQAAWFLHTTETKINFVSLCYHVGNEPNVNWLVVFHKCVQYSGMALLCPLLVWNHSSFQFSTVHISDRRHGIVGNSDGIETFRKKYHSLMISWFDRFNSKCFIW